MTIASASGRRDQCVPLLWLLLLALMCAVGARPVAAQDPADEFDHDRSVFPLEFKHALAPCESCHVQGVFAGTPRRCRDCHTQSGRIKATAPPSGHIRIVDDCDACHRSDLWRNVFRVDHAAVIGSCASCHNNFNAAGKSARHVQSSDLCGDCHVTFSWAGARYNHDNITGTCVSCHNGATAEGKHPGHIVSAESCENCHSTRAWEPVTRVDHGSVFGTCVSCHNGVTARGKHAQHPASGNDCSSCHTTFGWLPATR